MKKTFAKRSPLLLCSLVLGLSAAAWARVSGHKDYVVTHSDVVVGERETMRGDVVTDKSVTVLGTLQGDCVSLGGPVAVKGRVEGDLVSFGGPVALTGSVRGDLVAVGAGVDCAGLVEGSLVAVGAAVALKPGATVQGDVSALGGRVDQAPGAVVRGQVTSLTPGMLKRVLPPLMKFGTPPRRGDAGTVKERLALGGLLGAGLLAAFSLLVFGALMLLLPAIFFPGNVENVSREITEDFWKSAGVGAVIVMALFPAFLMMLFSIMGIPLIPLAMLLLAAAALLGFSGFSAVLARRFFEGIKRPAPAPLLAQVCLGYALLAAAFFVGHAVPVLGWLLGMCAFIVAAFGVLLGFGAAWNTRMGTRARPAAAPQFPPAAPPAQTQTAQSAPPPVTPA